MRSNRPKAKIPFKSDSNRLLIYFFDPISAVRSTRCDDSIRIWTIYIKNSLMLIENNLILINNGQILLTFLIKIDFFDLKIDFFYLLIFIFDLSIDILIKIDQK